MSITDSTTNLSAAWVEQTPVAFTTGVLSTIISCVNEVEAKLKRGTLSATSSPTLTNVKNWLKRGKLELMEAKNYTFSRKYAYTDLVAGGFRYALPPDFNGGNVRIRDVTNDNIIGLMVPEEWDIRFPNLANVESGDIEIACIKNMELWVYPPPASSDRIEIEYSRSGAETTADDFSYIPELQRFQCCDFALAHSFESLHMFDVADRFFAYWERDILKNKLADNRRKRGGKRLSAINVWQDQKINRGNTTGGTTIPSDGITISGDYLTL
jgi:hypothetical protein